MLELRHTLRRPLHVILDWDGTLTKKDTLAEVGSVAYQRPNPPPDLPPWSFFVDAYVDDYTAQQANYKPSISSRKTLREERAWLASLKPIETRSVRRVEASLLFKGITLSDVHATAVKAIESKSIQLRPGWLNLLRHLRGAPVFSTSASSTSETQNQTRSRVSILSVNWSKQFIRSVLRTALSRAPTKTPSLRFPPSDLSLTASSASSSAPVAPSTSAFLPDPLDSYVLTMEIVANEISALLSPSGSDGRLSKSDDDVGIRVAGDKLARLPERCRKRLDALTVSSSSKMTGIVDVEGEVDESAPAVVYVGDSTTDLECLLAADVGICVRDEPMGSSQRELAETLERVGVKCVRLREGMPDLPSVINERIWRKVGIPRKPRFDSEVVVYWVADLQEMLDVMENCESRLD